jgi:hypothetical protein
MNKRTILAIGIAALTATGCERKTPVTLETPPPTPTVIPPPVARTQTFETHALRKAIDAYELERTPVQSARVNKAFAEIDGEIAELVEHVLKKDGNAQGEAARKLADLRTYRESEMVRFKLLETTPASTGTLPAERRETVGEKVGEKIDKAAQKVEEGLRDAADAVRDKTR